MEAHIIVDFSETDPPTTLDELKRLIPNAVRFEPPIGPNGFFFDVIVEVADSIAKTADVVGNQGKPLRRILTESRRRFFLEDV